MADRIRILHVDDDGDFVDVAASLLEREDERFAVETATSASEGLDVLEASTLDCVVSDFDMPGQTGIDFLEAVRSDDPHLPFILYTGKGSEEVASDAIASGATDYLQKGTGTDQYTVLANRIGKAVSAYQTQRRLRDIEEKFTKLADRSRDVIFRVQDGEFDYVSPAVESLLGYAPAALVGVAVQECVHESSTSTVEEAFAAARAGEAVGDLSVTLVHAEGRPVDAEVSATRVRDGDGGHMILGFARTDAGARNGEDAAQQQSALLENSPDAFFVLDEDGTVLYQSNAPANACESRQRDLVGDTPMAHVHPDHHEDVRRDFEYLLDNPDETVTTEYRFETPTGEWRWAENRAINKLDDPVIEGILVVNRDVTERKRRERQLEETNALLSSLVETLPVGILVEDDARTVVTANQQLFDLLDLPGTPEAVEGADCAAFAREVSDRFADQDAFADRLAAVRDAGDAVDRETVTGAAGSVFERSYRPLDFPEGHGHLWVYRDVTDRTRREETLEDLTGRLEALHRATRDLMAAESREDVAEIGVEVAADVLGLEMNAIHLEEEGQRLVPVAATEAVYDLIGEPPTFTPGNSIAWRTFERGEAVTFDNVHDDEDVYDPDSPVHSEIQIPIADRGILMGGSPTPAAFDEQDVLLGELLAGNVATALEHVERTAELRERERELTRQNDRLEEFTRVVSHDLRNPLNVAAGRLELAREDLDSEHLDAIEGAHDRMATLIEDLLTLAREGATSTDLQPVDLSIYVERCWQTVDTREATLDAQVPATVLAEDGRLKQLFENLFRNAVEHGSTSNRASQALDDAVGHGGEDVTVTVGLLDGGFFVADDGPGVPQGDHDRVFEAGYSGTEDGTGFGLSIVKQVAEAHGWDVRVTESAAGGARFEITGVEFVDE